jgi:cytidylate kinase
MVVIVISGMPGCGSSTLGRLLAKKLKLKFFSAGMYNKSLARKLTGKSLKSEAERSLVVWESKKGSSKRFHNDCDRYFLKLAKKGNIVIDTKLGVRLMKGHYDLGVWLKAPLSVRAKRYARRDGTPLKKAMADLKKKQGYERKNFKKIYGFDYFSQGRDANLILDTSKKTPEELADEVLKRLNKG